MKIAFAFITFLRPDFALHLNHARADYFEFGNAIFRKLYVAPRHA